ncbi:hypothetical protein AAC387_Pa02g3382 [Persea americana]
MKTMKTLQIPEILTHREGVVTGQKVLEAWADSNPVLNNVGMHAKANNLLIQITAEIMKSSSSCTRMCLGALLCLFKNKSCSSPGTRSKSCSSSGTRAKNGADACNSHSKAFQDCLNSSGSDISKCQFYIDALNECRRNSGSMPSA